MLLTVVIPTVRGRERWVRLAKDAIRATVPSTKYETIVVPSLTCGAGWSLGAAQARGRYIALSCDDVEWLPGWWEQASSLCDAGFLPAPVVMTPEGKVQSCGGSVEKLEPHGAVTAFTRAPFMSARQYRLIRPLLETQYFCDNWVSFRGQRAGFQTVVAHDYRCIHHDAQEGKVDVAERLHQDRLTFEAACAKDQA